jgi:signal transduction histidine kinase/ligand-binding sensor domain-containing protein
MTAFRLSFIFALLLLLPPLRAEAHNGAIAVAVPVSNITVDGDFSDWPDGLKHYAFTNPSFVAFGDEIDQGNFRVSRSSIQGSFRVGYSAIENALYVAAEIQDDSIFVVSSKRGRHGNGQDGCELHVDIAHEERNSPAAQGYIWGNDRGIMCQPEDWTTASCFEVEVSRGNGFHRYEWRVDIGRMSEGQTQLQPGMALGFDLGVFDRDGDDLGTWTGWGRGVNKIQVTDHRGDLVLADETAKTGYVQGKVSWQEDAQGVSHPRVRFQSRDTESSWMRVIGDQNGSFAAELPAGSYLAIPEIGRGRQEKIPFDVERDGDTRISLEAEETGEPGSEWTAVDANTIRAGMGRQLGLWQNFGVVDGLPVSRIISILEGRRGGLWILSSGDHLMHFNGSQFSTFSLEGISPTANPTSMIQDRHGNIWFGTVKFPYGNGALRFEVPQDAGLSPADGRFANYTSADGLPSDIVYATYEDSEGNIWFGTESGVSRFDGRRFTTFNVDDGLLYGRVMSILEDSKGDFWFGTLGGISRYDGEHFTQWTADDGLPPYSVSVILEDKEGNVWFGTQGGGIGKYYGRRDIGERLTIFNMDDGLARNHIRSALEDSEGKIWFGTVDGGVTCYDGRKPVGERFTTFNEDGGLVQNNVFSIAEDSEKNIWFGTGHGISRYGGLQFLPISLQGELADNPITPIIRDQDGKFWLGSYANGLVRFDGVNFERFTREDGLPNNLILSIAEDRQGYLWLGSARGEIIRFDGRNLADRQDIGKRFTSFAGSVEDSIADDARSVVNDRTGNIWLETGDVLSILEDRAGNIWFERFGDGVVRFNAPFPAGQQEAGERWRSDPADLTDPRFTHFTTEDGLMSNYIFCMFEGREGDLWFGTGGGANRYDDQRDIGDRFTHFTTEDGLAQNVVLSILEDRAGNVWFGTMDGVSRYDDRRDIGDRWRSDPADPTDRRFTHFTIKDGLVGDVVQSIFEDREGNLWFGTNGGVSRYDGLVFQSLLERDGLAQNYTSGIVQDDDGTIWLSHWDKLTRYRPSSVAPPVEITNIISDVEHGSIAELWLPSSQDYLAFEFQGRSFRTRPGQMVYVYRLLGYEEDWQQTRDVRVEYTDLPRGDYTFEVKTVDRDLNYSESPATVAVHVHLPHERLAWLNAFIVVLLFFVWQTVRVVRRDRRLQQTNQALSDANNELFQVNSSLQKTNQQLESANREIQESTRRKSEFLARMSHDLRTPMNAIIGYTRLLMRKLRGSIDDRQLRNLENIQTSSNNLLNLINEILDLSRVEAGRIEVNPAEVDLAQLAEECAASVESLIGKRVEFHRRFEEVPTVRTDREIVRKVLMNLLGNAVKFTEEGSITLSVRSLDGWVELSVADTGMGIPAADLPFIFEEFRQVERQGSTEKEGTGLGLAIAKKSVELLGGEISAESEVEKGTMFLLKLRDYEG